MVGPKILCFDLETTGLGKTKNIGICEIAIIDGDNGSTLLQEYVNPSFPIQKNATKTNGMRKEFLKHYPNWNQIGRKVQTLLEDLQEKHGEVILAGFNSKRPFFHHFVCLFSMLILGCFFQVMILEF